LFIGKSGDNSKYFIGIIDDVRVWDFAKSEDDFVNDWGREVGGTSLSLRGYYKFNLGLGTLVEDSSAYLFHGNFVGGEFPDWVEGLVPVRRHIFGLFESQDSTAELLLSNAWSFLQGRNEPRINIQARVSDLERAVGYEHEKIRLGDSVFVIAKNFIPEIRATARVIRIERNFNNPGDTRVELGNFRQTTSEDLLFDLEQSRRRLEARSGIIERGEFFEFVGDPEFEYALDIGERNIRIFGSTDFYFDGSGIFAFNPLNHNHYWRFDNLGLRLTLDGGLTHVHDFGLNEVIIGTDAIFRGSLEGVDGTFEGSLSGVDGTFTSLLTGNPVGARLNMFLFGGLPRLQMHDASNLRIDVQTDRIRFLDDGNTLVGQISGVVATPGLPISGELRISAQAIMKLEASGVEVDLIPGSGVDIKHQLLVRDVLFANDDVLVSGLLEVSGGFLDHIRLNRSGVPQNDFSLTSLSGGGFIWTFERDAGHGTPSRLLYVHMAGTRYSLRPGDAVNQVDLGSTSQLFDNIYGHVLWMRHGGVTARVVHTGANANGRWITFADGTQICFAQFNNINAEQFGTSGSYSDPRRSAFFDWTFPAAFAGDPVIMGDVKTNDTSGSLNTRCWALAFTPPSLGSGNTDSTGTRVQAVKFGGFAGGAYTINYNLFAFGRWK
jgi:hypothetical protein